MWSSMLMRISDRIIRTCASIAQTGSATLTPSSSTICTRAGLDQALHDQAHDIFLRNASGKHHADMGSRRRARGSPGSGVGAIARTFQVPLGKRGLAAPTGTMWEGSGLPGGGVLSIQEQPGNAPLVTEDLGRAVYGPGKQK